MAYQNRRGKAGNEVFTSVRTNGRNTLEAFETQEAIQALGKLALACVQGKASLYLRANRDASLTVRIYDGDEKYEEVLSGSEDLDLAVEETIEGIWGRDTVTQVRRAAVGVASQAARGATKQARVAQRPENEQTEAPQG